MNVRYRRKLTITPVKADDRQRALHQPINRSLAEPETCRLFIQLCGVRDI
ncbi:hypothetical protein ACT009_02080 [Sphingomonas sp. Tas61C01]